MKNILHLAFIIDTLSFVRHHTELIRNQQLSKPDSHQRECFHPLCHHEQYRACAKMRQQPPPLKIIKVSLFI